MADNKSGCTTWIYLIMAVISLPVFLLLTVFNGNLDKGTRLSYLLLSLPSLLLAFVIVMVGVVGAVLFIPVFLDSDAWPVGVYALIFVGCALYQLIRRLKK